MCMVDYRTLSKNSAADLFRPPEIIWAYWKEVLDIPQSAILPEPLYLIKEVFI